MTQPTPPFINITLDKSVYAPGEQMTATVAYGVPEDSVARLAGRLEFLGGVVTTAPVEVQIAELLIDDDAGREWILQSNDGSTATFSATA